MGHKRKTVIGELKSNKAKKKPGPIHRLKTIKKPGNLTDQTTEITQK